MNKWHPFAGAVLIFVLGGLSAHWVHLVLGARPEPPLPQQPCPLCATVGECWDGCLSFTEYATEQIVRSCTWTVEEQQWCDELADDRSALQEWRYEACDAQISEVYDACATAEIQRGFCPSLITEDVCMCLDLDLDRDECKPIWEECVGEDP